MVYTSEHQDRGNFFSTQRKIKLVRLTELLSVLLCMIKLGKHGMIIGIGEGLVRNLLFSDLLGLIFGCAVVWVRLNFLWRHHDELLRCDHKEKGLHKGKYKATRTLATMGANVLEIPHFRYTPSSTMILAIKRQRFQLLRAEYMTDDNDPNMILYLRRSSYSAGPKGNLASVNLNFVCRPLESWLTSCSRYARLQPHKLVTVWCDTPGYHNTTGFFFSIKNYACVGVVQRKTETFRCKN